MEGRWVDIEGDQVILRCWWNNPQRESKHLALIFPEVFGINSWVRSIVDRLAEKGIPSLAIPLFARTAPQLDLGYSDKELLEGRRHKEQTTTNQILEDTSTALKWLKQQYSFSKVTAMGFCFGGHAALIASTLSDIDSTYDFYGAGVTEGRPGGGPPTLKLLNKVSGKLTCICGTADTLIPLSERIAIKSALNQEDPQENRLRYVEIEGAKHGFMCEERSSFSANASSISWHFLINDFDL